MLPVFARQVLEGDPALALDGHRDVAGHDLGIQDLPLVGRLLPPELPLVTVLVLEFTALHHVGPVVTAGFLADGMGQTEVDCMARCSSLSSWGCPLPTSGPAAPGRAD